MKKPAAFLDRDGTLIDERGYLGDPGRIRFYPSVVPALKRLRKAGYRLVVISNQSGVGRGYFTMDTLKKVNRRFLQLLRSRGVRIDGVYFCPHLPAAGCSCRKPAPGMAKKAARDLALDVRRSFVIGDQVRDLQLARRVGATGVLVLTGAGRASRRKAKRLAAKVTSNVGTASVWIAEQGGTHAR